MRCSGTPTWRYPGRGDRAPPPARPRRSTSKEQREGRLPRKVLSAGIRADRTAGTRIQTARRQRPGTASAAASVTFTSLTSALATDTTDPSFLITTMVWSDTLVSFPMTSLPSFFSAVMVLLMSAFQTSSETSARRRGAATKERQTAMTARRALGHTVFLTRFSFELDLICCKGTPSCSFTQRKTGGSRERSAVDCGRPGAEPGTHTTSSQGGVSSGQSAESVSRATGYDRKRRGRRPP